MVIGGDGRPVAVTDVIPHGVVPVYKVTFKDGASTRCSSEHLWTIKKRGLEWREVETNDLLNAGDLKSWMIPVSPPVELSHKDLPLDPYLVGAILGNGCMARVLTIAGQEDLYQEVEKVLPADIALRVVKNNVYNRRIISKTGSRKDTIRGMLKSLGIYGLRSWEKFIPISYLMGDIEQRLALFQGLMDTDGWACRDRASIKYATASERLANDIIQLAESLGCTTALHVLRDRTYAYKGQRLKGRPSWTISIKYPPEMVPFRLKRKSEAMLGHGKGSHKPHRYFDSIEYIGEQESVCITVANTDGLYVTERFIVTHNCFPRDFIGSWRAGYLERQLSYVDGLIIEFDPYSPDVPEQQPREHDDTYMERLKSWAAWKERALKHLAMISASMWVIWSDSPTMTMSLCRYIESNPSLQVRTNLLKVPPLPVRQRLIAGLPRVNPARRLDDGRTWGQAAEEMIDWEGVCKALRLDDWTWTSGGRRVLAGPGKLRLRMAIEKGDTAPPSDGDGVNEKDEGAAEED